MFKSKLKSLARLKKGSMGNSCAASPSPESGEEKQRDREKKKLTISAPISLEEFKAQQDRSQEDVSELPTHHALDLTSPKDEEPSIEEIMGEEQQTEPSTYQNQHELEPPEEEEGGEEQEEDEEREERDSSGMGTDDESLPELFEPSSPLQIGSNFLLPDIMEESENERSESLRSSLLSSDGMIIKSPSKQEFTKFDPFEETGLDVVETNFDTDVPLPVNDDNRDDEQAPDASGSLVDPPILPVSPPPGPLLSPRYSMMLLESSEQDDHNRFSIVSVSSEIAPPLPTSLPPGKLIPRESLLYQDPESKIDLWYELKRTNEEKINSGDSNSHEELKADAINHDPIIKSEEAETSHKFIEYLSTSDSGFPDTDMATDHSTGGRNIDTPIGNPHQFISVATKNSSTSIASCSDERTTEYSGSIGLKTNFSSGSQHSPSEAESHENDDANSMSTKIGDCEQNEGEPHVHPPPVISSPPLSPEQGETIKPSIRKTGWLEVKTVLVRKNRKVAMASKRKWKKYWATLKGSSLLFYQCDDSIMEYDLPELKLDLELSLAHTVHDHVKRDHIFCLSTNNGNTYYMQTISQSEVDDWITTIHCAAATVLSGHHNKEDAIAVLKDKVKELGGDIEKEKKLRNLTELAATNSDIKSMASDQLIVCSENIEKYKLNLYRVRCYIASLEGNELPNPQSLLASVSKPTKLALGRVGMFSVASLNAIVCSRAGMVTSSSSWSLRPKLSIPSSPSAIFRTKSRNDSPKSPKGSDSTKTSKRGLEISGPILKVSPNSSPASTSKLTARERSRSLPRSPKSRRPLEIFRQLSPQPSQPSARSKLISLPKRTQERKLSTPDLRSKEISGPYPLVISLTSLVTTSPTFTPKSGQSNQQEITNMEENVDFPAGVPVWSTGSASVQADYNGDKVNIIDDKDVHELEQKELQDLTDSASRLVMTVRSKSYPGSSLSPTPPILESLICPAPPSHQAEITGEHLLRLTVPRPGSESSEGTLMEPPSPSITQDQIDLLLNDSREVSKLIDVWEMSQPPPAHTAWTRLDKLRKSATDLVETESEYVTNLEILTKRYLEPLERASVLPLNDVNTLVGNIPDILSTQRTFLKRLEDSLELERDHPKALDEENKLKHVVIGMSRALVEYAAEHFREYGTFCSSRQKIKQILAHEGNKQLHQFLEARNPERDTSLNIEALLAKPMVRISRYPLFINAMMDNTLADSEEKKHLKDALEAMTRVADYINEVQRLCETYGTVLDSLLKNQALLEQHNVSVKVSQLKNQSEVMWLNPADEQLAKGWKKGQGPMTACLVFDASIVLLCLDKKLKRKENKVVQELAVAEDEIRFKMLLPCAKCSIYDLPDSDGVTNMWRLQYRSNSNFDKCVDYLLRSQSVQQKLSTLQAIRQCIHQQPQRLHWGPSQGTKVKAASTSALPSFDRQTSHNMSIITESSTDSHNHNKTSHSSLPS